MISLPSLPPSSPNPCLRFPKQVTPFPNHRSSSRSIDLSMFQRCALPGNAQPNFSSPTLPLAINQPKFWGMVSHEQGSLCKVTTTNPQDRSQESGHLPPKREPGRNANVRYETVGKVLLLFHYLCFLLLFPTGICFCEHREINRNRTLHVMIRICSLAILPI
ncbi:hypothetical protein BGX38DRAFT_920505 [Terfezia claveryi]|nr:hypothetical protein BGX38DRAFT_920505 [Terfezia claveryi]